MPVLPSELWALIVSFVVLKAEANRADILSLLTVSRQMHTVAEPWLLGTVALRIPSAMRNESQSSIIQFHHYISTPNDYRRSLVQSLSIDLLQDIPFPNEVQALDQLIPTLTNLRSLTLRFAAYSSTLHGHLRLFEEGISGVSLRALEIAVNDTDNDPDITELLRSQPSIHLLNLSGYFPKVDNDKNLLPALRSLSASLDSHFNHPHLDVDGIVHLSTTFWCNTRFILTSPMNTLTTLSCLVQGQATFHAFLPMVPNLTYLGIYINHNVEKAMATLSPLRYTKITHIRCPIYVQWISKYARSNDIFGLDGFPSSLKCVELAIDQDASDTSEGPPCNLRWYRGRGNPVKVRWSCAASEIWHADWERDVMVE